MIRGHDIVCCAPDPWYSIWRNRQQIMSLLAEANRILFVEPRAYLRPTLAAFRCGELGLRDLRRPLVEPVRPNLWRFQYPAYAPISGRYPLSAWMYRLQVWALRRAMQGLGFSRPLLWLYRPDDRDLIGQLGERLVIYHVVDEYSAYEEGYEDRVAPGKREAMRRKEQALLRQADLVFAVSRPLWEAKRQFNLNTHLVPNGVNYEAFRAAVGTPPPADLAAVPAPRVGYVGNINEKIDLVLLRRLAEARPDWSLVLVGPVSLRFDLHLVEDLRRASVHFLGQKPVEALPAYVANLDVCLMPYKRNEWTRHISPLKMYEYLACGKPIVSTDIPAAREFAHLLYLAEGPEAFLSLVERALGEADPALARARQEEASRHTWRARVEQMSALMAEALAAKA
ncbi:MAG: glycosyltransferase [Anaerolineae bacterium]|nr:glycosyltransferase [Anaerolineae bacterium]